MANPKLKRLLDEYASAVASVVVRNDKGDEEIGTAFHVGEGIYVTARHVIHKKEILSVATKQSTYRRSTKTPGAFETVHAHGLGRLSDKPLYHPDDKADVALLLVDGIGRAGCPRRPLVQLLHFPATIQKVFKSYLMRQLCYPQ